MLADPEQPTGVSSDCDLPLPLPFVCSVELLPLSPKETTVTTRPNSIDNFHHRTHHQQQQSSFNTSQPTLVISNTVETTGLDLIVSTGTNGPKEREGEGHDHSLSRGESAKPHCFRVSINDTSCLINSSSVRHLHPFRTEEKPTDPSLLVSPDKLSSSVSSQPSSLTHVYARGFRRLVASAVHKTLVPPTQSSRLFHDFLSLPFCGPLRLGALRYNGSNTRSTSPHKIVKTLCVFGKLRRGSCLTSLRLSSSLVPLSFSTMSSNAKKVAILLALLVQNCVVVMLTRHVRVRERPPSVPLFSVTSVVMTTEIVKIVVCFLWAAWSLFEVGAEGESNAMNSSSYDGLTTRSSSHRKGSLLTAGIARLTCFMSHMGRTSSLIFCRKDAAYMMIPAALFTFQNNILYVALENLEVSAFQIVYQSKLFLTSVLVAIVFRKKYSIVQWISLLTLFLGVVATQLDAGGGGGKGKVGGKDQKMVSAGNATLGALAALSAAFSSAVASVVMEKLLKVASRHEQVSSFVQIDANNEDNVAKSKTGGLERNGEKLQTATPIIVSSACASRPEAFHEMENVHVLSEEGAFESSNHRTEEGNRGRGGEEQHQQRIGTASIRIESNSSPLFSLVSSPRCDTLPRMTTPSHPSRSSLAQKTRAAAITSSSVSDDVLSASLRTSIVYDAISLPARNVQLAFYSILISMVLIVAKQNEEKGPAPSLSTNRTQQIVRFLSDDLKGSSGEDASDFSASFTKAPKKYSKKTSLLKPNPKSSNDEDEKATDRTQADVQQQVKADSASPRVLVANENGFFAGFDVLVWLVVLFQALGGIIVAFVLRYADNVLKGCSVAMAIVVCGLFSIFLFGMEPSFYFVVGAVTVTTSVFVFTACS